MKRNSRCQHSSLFRFRARFLVVKKIPFTWVIVINTLLAKSHLDTTVLLAATSPGNQSLIKRGWQLLVFQCQSTRWFRTTHDPAIYSAMSLMCSMKTCRKKTSSLNMIRSGKKKGPFNFWKESTVTSFPSFKLLFSADITHYLFTILSN